MFPITKRALSVRDIADYWSREIDPRASKYELLNTLVAAWWLGEFRGHSRHSRLELLKIMSTSNELGIAFIVGEPDGSLARDPRPRIRVPSGDPETWDELACRDAFDALSEVTEKSSIKSFSGFAVFLLTIELTYEEFNTWRKKRRFHKPKFWRLLPNNSKRGRPAEYNWVGVKAKLKIYVSTNGPIQTRVELIQKCADFAYELHPGKKKKTPDDKTIREAIKTHALDAAVGLDPGK